jgi:hypothetical protein
MDVPLDDRESLGVGLKPGDAHYRAYVGPPEDYDLIAAMAFNLVTTLGLRQHHSLLDLGCGSLRIRRLLIPYLNRGKYFGVEPNEWLVEEGIKREIGEALLEIKRPTFFFPIHRRQLPRRKSHSISLWLNRSLVCWIERDQELVGRDFALTC